MFLGAPARADLCDSVKDTTTTTDAKRDVDFYEQLFPDPSGEYRGNRRWNEIVVQCNRQRDINGREVARITATLGTSPDRKTLESRNLEPKVIRGYYNFFGTVVTRLKYVYVLSKTNGVWSMVIPYNPIINDVVPGRIDFDADSGGHAWELYDASQVVNPTAAVPTLKTGARPIAETLCSSFTYFSGDEGKYDDQTGTNAHKRDKENKFISLGRIEYYYKDKGEGFLSVGCRVNRTRDVYWVDPDTGKLRKSKADAWVLDTFVRTAEGYWTIPGVFELKLLMKGRNDKEFPASMRALLNEDDHLTVRFATKFMPYGANQMYKSNPIQFNNFSTMTSDGTYWHEVGHAFATDDEYGGEDKSNDCENAQYKSYSPKTYQMCDAGADEKRTIYHYLAATRYITKQSECKQDPDCAAGEYCNKGVDLTKNQCVAKKADNDGCDLASGARQCKSGHCKLGRCYTPHSAAMGAICYVNDACAEGKCSSIDGTRGTCVCKDDADCGPGKYCDGGVDAKVNACRAKLDKGETCGTAVSVGNDHKCKSGECSGFPGYKCK
jgi:hypothetical protein